MGWGGTCGDFANHMVVRSTVYVRACVRDLSKR